MSQDMHVKVERRTPTPDPVTIAATRLYRSNVELRGDAHPSVLRELFYANVDIDKRNMERKNPHLLTIGIAETLDNLAIVNRLALGEDVPDDLQLLTRDPQGQIISHRSFVGLVFRSSSVSYSVMAGREQPVHKIVYECTLGEAWYFDRETSPPAELKLDRVRTFER